MHLKATIPEVRRVGRTPAAATEGEVQEGLGDGAKDCDAEHDDHECCGNQRGAVRVLRLPLGVKVVVYQRH